MDREEVDQLRAMLSSASDDDDTTVPSDSESDLETVAPRSPIPDSQPAKPMLLHQLPEEDQQSILTDIYEYAMMKNIRLDSCKKWRVKFRIPAVRWLLLMMLKRRRNGDKDSLDFNNTVNMIADFLFPTHETFIRRYMEIKGEPLTILATGWCKESVRKPCEHIPYKVDVPGKDGNGTRCEIRHTMEVFTVHINTDMPFKAFMYSAPQVCHRVMGKNIAMVRHITARRDMPTKMSIMVANLAWSFGGFHPDPGNYPTPLDFFTDHDI